MSTPRTELAGLAASDAAVTIDGLGRRLAALLDLQLTLKHVHWNVTGPSFVAVHEMLDRQTDEIRAMTDDLAERIAVLGGVPVGTPAAIVGRRAWDDYAVGRADAAVHLRALDRVYDGIIGDHRALRERFAMTDPVSEDLLIGQLRELELHQWFFRSHLGDAAANGDPSIRQLSHSN